MKFLKVKEALETLPIGNFAQLYNGFMRELDLKPRIYGMDEFGKCFESYSYRMIRNIMINSAEKYGKDVLLHIHWFVPEFKEKGEKITGIIPFDLVKQQKYYELAGMLCEQNYETGIEDIDLMLGHASKNKITILETDEIKALALSTRTYNVVIRGLYNLNFERPYIISDITLLSETQVREMRNMGKNTLFELKTALQRNGFKLREETERETKK